MKRTISNLKGVKTLSKTEQQTINGSRGPQSQSDLCKHLCFGIGSGQGLILFETVCNCE